MFKKWKKHLPDPVRVLLTPGCWLMNHPYSKEWDKELNRLIKTHEFKNHSFHEVELGSFKIWVANHPYASFTIVHVNKMIRPKRSTVLKCGDLLFTCKENSLKCVCHQCVLCRNIV